MRPPRFTVRRLIIAVAVVGLLLGVLSMLGRRREHALGMARLNDARWMARLNDARWNRSAKLPGAAENPRLHDRHTDHYARMELKWLSAARRPWLPFEDDPLEPK